MNRLESPPLKPQQFQKLKLEFRNPTPQKVTIAIGLICKRKDRSPAIILASDSQTTYSATTAGTTSR